MHNFEFAQPSTIDEAVAALKADEAQALGGGQTLIPTMKQRLAAHLGNQCQIRGGALMGYCDKRFST